MNNSKNFNTDYYNENNFEEAYKFAEDSFSHDELCKMLKHGNIPQKQIAALKFDYIYSIEDVKLILDNLTGCDGKIREAIAYKINSIICEYPETKALFADISAETFAKATIDINANICRLTVDSAKLLKNYNNFAELYSSIILKYTNEAIIELDKFIFKDKKYVINKQLFKLYWCLEAISYFYEFIDEKILADILYKCASQQEYTIREKCAQIIVITNKFSELKNQLKNDENYYVRQVFTSSKHL